MIRAQDTGETWHRRHLGTHCQHLSTVNVYLGTLVEKEVRTPARKEKDGATRPVLETVAHSAAPLDPERRYEKESPFHNSPSGHSYTHRPHKNSNKEIFFFTGNSFPPPKEHKVWDDSQKRQLLTAYTSLPKRHTRLHWGVKEEINRLNHLM